MVIDPLSFLQGVRVELASWPKRHAYNLSNKGLWCPGRRPGEVCERQYYMAPQLLKSAIKLARHVTCPYIVLCSPLCD